VFLELFVKVESEWRASRGFVEELDWRRQLEQIAEKQGSGIRDQGSGSGDDGE
jgi:GTP-binding protein Era